jgi:hypothetical protein
LHIFFVTYIVFVHKVCDPNVSGRIINIFFSELGQKYIVTSRVGNSDSSGEQSQTSTDSTQGKANATSFASTTDSSDSIDMKPQRPSFLDLCGGSSTPGSSRKQKFTFSAAATEDTLAATSESTDTTLGSASQYCPTASSSSDEFRTHCVDDSSPNYDSNLPTEPASMPPLTNLSSTSSTSTAFSYRNPAYQSAHPSCYMSNNQNSMRKSMEDTSERASDQDIPGKLFKHQTGSGSEGSRGLLKWKGIVFTPENGEAEQLESSDITSSSDKEHEEGNQVTRSTYCSYRIDWLCHSSGGPGLSPCQVMWDLWWTK